MQAQLNLPPMALRRFSKLLKLFLRSIKGKLSYDESNRSMLTLTSLPGAFNMNLIN